MRLFASVMLLVSLDVSAADLNLSYWSVPVTVDGNLNEACYRQPPTVSKFVVAGQLQERPQQTKAWLFWNSNQLLFAFECTDRDIVARRRTKNEHDVDTQDRVELFLWSGRESDAYGCMEIGARGALHDYLARFYRQFDDTWTATGCRFAVRRTSHGYRVEGILPRSLIQSLGLRLEPGARWKVGLFRADFSSSSASAEPTWITWIDARGPKPDFHVTKSFGDVVLLPPDRGQRKESPRPSLSVR